MVHKTTRKYVSTSVLDLLDEIIQRGETPHLILKSGPVLEVTPPQKVRILNNEYLEIIEPMNNGDKVNARIALEYVIGVIS